VREAGILAAMSAIAIVVIVIAALLLLLFAGGLVGALRRRQRLEERLRGRILEADRALEAARAADRGWDRVVLEAAAREALERERPEFHYDSLELVLVEDRPGTEEDRAQMAAIGADGELRIVLVRHGELWRAETLA
jgi:type II secretory pathway pseudopilin PulG